jgi:hypothetical protein
VRRRGNTRASSCSPDKSHIRLGGRLSPAGRPRSRSTCEGAGRRDPDRRCAQTASIDRPSDFAVVAVGPGRISRNAHVASRTGAENGRGRLAGARGCASAFDGGCFESPRAGDRARGAPCQARTAADPNRRSSGRQSRNCAASGFEPTCRSAAVASRSNSANGSCAVAAFSAPRIGAARQPADQLRSADRGLRHLSAYRVSAERHVSGSPFGSRRQN